jgi:hypothetical protein
MIINGFKLILIIIKKKKLSDTTAFESLSGNDAQKRE